MTPETIIATLTNMAAPHPLPQRAMLNILWGLLKKAAVPGADLRELTYDAVAMAERFDELAEGGPHAVR